MVFLVLNINKIQHFFVFYVTFTHGVIFSFQTQALENIESYQALIKKIDCFDLILLFHGA